MNPPIWANQATPPGLPIPRAVVPLRNWMRNQNPKKMRAGMSITVMKKKRKTRVFILAQGKQIM